MGAESEIPGGGLELVQDEVETAATSEQVVAVSHGEFPTLGRRRFGRYELLIEMGSGGMATLFLARLSGPQDFEKLLAIKKIHDHLARQPDFVNMFLDEARLSARIQHPNVASIFDLGDQDGAYFIAMEYVHGQNLIDVIKAGMRQKGVFGWEHACRIAAEAAAGLHAAHELKGKDGKLLNVVHRDVSPQNILLSYDGHVKVVDFGIAFASERSSETQVGTLKGKLGYMSPEQTTKDPVDRRADVFALGIVLFEMCTRRRLFRGDTDAETVLLVREADVPRPREIAPMLPVELERILLKALAKRPKDRYATAERFAEDLEALLVASHKVVNRSSLARLMEQLFYDRQRLKDEQINRAMDEPHTDPLVGVGMGPITDNSLVSPEVTQKATSRKLYGAVIGVAALLIVGVVLFVALRGGSMPDKGEKPAPPKPTMDRPVQAPPKTVTLRVDVEPPVPGAVVEFRGQPHKGSQFKIVVPRSKGSERIRITAPGHLDDSVVVVPVADSRVKVTLKPAPRPRPEVRPRARPRKRPRARPRRRPRRRPRPMGGLRDFPE